MFVRVFLVQLKNCFRSKKYMFWTAAFPIVLGTLFAAVFSSIYDNSKSTSIPVAVIEEKDANDEGFSFTDAMDLVTYDDGTKIFKQVKVDSRDEADKMLDKEDIKGIIIVNGVDDINLKIHENGIYESIIISFIKNYKQKADLFKNMDLTNLNLNNTDINELLENIDTSKEYTETRGLMGENNDPYVDFFYNLIAMVCLMGSIAVFSVIIISSANQSNEGVRIDMSPVSKPLFELASFCAVTFIQMIILFVTIIYLIYVHNINFGVNIWSLYLTAVAGTILGGALGFFIGHIYKINENLRETILMTIMLGGGFLSGLMGTGGIKGIMIEKCPIVNKINPAAVITDAFYSLNMYGIGTRYYKDMLVLLGISALLILCGMFMSRRKQYASL